MPLSFFRAALSYQYFIYLLLSCQLQRTACTFTLQYVKQANTFIAYI